MQSGLRHGGPAVALVLAACAAADAQVEGWKWQPPADRPFPILTWMGPPANLLTDRVWGDVAEAGFNLCLAPFQDAAANRKALALGRKHGIGLVLRDPRLNWREKSVEKLTANLGAVTDQWAKEPALAAYYLTDEPNASDFAALARARDVLARLDGGHWAYVNLFPNYASSAQLGTQAYPDHVTRFMKTFRPQVLSYDHYCILTPNRVRPGYFENLEIIRAAAIESGVPFWAFTLSTPHFSYPMPTEGHLRFQLYSDLVYGAKGLQYFTYSPALKNDGLIDSKGNRTQTFRAAGKVNRGIQNMGSVLGRLRSTAVFHTPPLPRGTKAFQGHGGLLTCSGAPAVLGFFDAPGGGKYLMVVNRNPARRAELTLTFAEGAFAEKPVGEVDRSKKGGILRPVKRTGREFRLALMEGDGRLFELKTGTGRAAGGGDR